ncbi:hypothetical protein KUCAC02_026379 [Chaenocephalus aceratus]|uniref:Uncharacterized protein n=1 Tax=Chaenocephalus aceratus TaxID=36190 RepID=A0ACB9VXB6_CHAAC|nr:hypothetical protein KUCAC02_026379 [Chaenocephalus aceratus]
MASKTSKKEKRDEAAATAVASMPFLVKLLEDHRDALSKEFKSAMTSLEAKLDFVQETVTDHGNRLTSLEATRGYGSQPRTGGKSIFASVEDATSFLETLQGNTSESWTREEQ